MRRVKELVKKASKDFELAKMHKQLKEYVTANILYNKAVETVLKALFISNMKKEPPKNASIEYLARNTGVLPEVSVYIDSLQEHETDDLEAEDFVDPSYKGISEERSAERQAFYMEGLAKRLLDYVSAYGRV